jgi:RNA polymerase sigma-70 factor (ECF subfamily)
MAATEVLSDEFGSQRRGLLAHCYRMLGSWDEAEDLVQDTYLRALQGWPTFENRSSVRTWLYRIATNACLTALAGRNRRALPSGLGAPADDADAPADVAGPETWIQPIPTAAIAADPASVVTGREDVRLAFIAGLQYLPPKQRAVLLLREVLAFPAAEVAEVLSTSVPAVKSMLQRARATLDQAAPIRDDVLEPTEPRVKELLEGYMAAWVAGDPDAFGRVLRVDAALEAVPSRTWFAGKSICVTWTRPFFAEPGAWQMRPTSANGQPAAVAHFRGEPYGVAVLTPAADGITRVTVFGDPGLVTRF